MSAIASIVIDPAPRLAPELLFWVRLPSDRAESLVRLEHVNAGSPPTAVVCVLSGDREGETLILPPGCPMREDSGAFTEPGFPRAGQERHS